MKNISYLYIGKINTEIPLLYIVTYISNVITTKLFFWRGNRKTALKCPTYHKDPKAISSKNNKMGKITGSNFR